MASPRINDTESGFTLVELMFVTALIAVLVFIAVVSYVATIPGAEEMTCRANQRIFEEAVVQYKAVTGSSPTTMADLEPYVRSAHDSYAVCPSDPSVSYELDPATGDVSCPLHP